MGDCSEICRCRPDGGHGPSGRTTVRQEILRFSLKIFHVWEPRPDGEAHCLPDGRTSAASNFHIRLRASGPWGMAIRTVDLLHAISILVERASGPLQTDVRTVEFELRTCLMETRVRTGNQFVRTVEAIFPYLHLERIGSLISYWKASGRAAETSGWLQAGTEASRYSEGFGWKSMSSERRMLGLLASERYGTSSGQMEQWTDERPDGMTRCPDGWQRTKFFWLVSSAKSFDIILNSGIPVKNIFTYKWFCQPECSQSKPNKLPLWPFWDKNHLTGLEIHSRSK
jgi:hypothetical protein